jgi:hypothetical protein
VGSGFPNQKQMVVAADGDGAARARGPPGCMGMRRAAQRHYEGAAHDRGRKGQRRGAGQRRVRQQCMRRRQHRAPPVSAAAAARRRGRAAAASRRPARAFPPQQRPPLPPPPLGPAACPACCRARRCSCWCRAASLCRARCSQMRYPGWKALAAARSQRWWVGRAGCDGALGAGRREGRLRPRRWSVPLQANSMGRGLTALVAAPRPPPPRGSNSSASAPRWWPLPRWACPRRL